MNKVTTAILLATYNSERFLREQLDSLYAQTYSGWTLYVHDDGSTDSTLTILEEYARANGNVVILDYSTQGNAKDNFLTLLAKVDADYYFFCDHDDVWHQDKMEHTLASVVSAEADDASTPVVAYTDLTVVDEELRVIHPSMWKYQGLHPERIHSFADYAAQVPATGCTMCFNAAAKRCLKMPATKAKMHDVWLLLCVAKSGGKIVALPQSTVFYRQHNDNVEGARSRWQRYTLRSVLTFYNRNRETYRMLASLDYGSTWKYIYHKIKFYL